MAEQYGAQQWCFVGFVVVELRQEWNDQAVEKVEVVACEALVLC